MKFTLIMILIGSLAHAETFVRCHDGDTCWFDKAGKKFKVRFSGIDAPEADQPLGTEARNFMVNLLRGKSIRLECKGKSGDREACAVYVGNIDTQRELVLNGYAMDYPKYSKGKYKEEEEIARAKKIGIWSKKDNTSPHCWRWLGTPECNKNKLYQPE